MLKCASVFTYEIDDPEIALEEIKSQLEEQISLLEHSVGIVMCHPEFIGTGVLKRVCEGLPFDLAGVTTASQAVNGEAGELILTIFVMTSDDALFRAGVTGSLDEEIEGPTRSAYRVASADVAEAPKLALVFPPLVLKYAGDMFVDTWGKIIPNVPIFGTHAIDDTLSFSESETIFNGESYKNAMPFVLCYGNINPRFLIGTLPEDSQMPYKGEVTKSSGPLVQEINNINAYKYFEDLGFASDGAPTDSFLFVPFMVNKKGKDDDGTPVLRVLSSFTEDGTAIFRGNIDENSTFTLLNCSLEDIVSTTARKFEEIRNMPDVNGALSFSCIIRRMVAMERDSLLEMENAKNTLRDIPFMVGYAGGEICPTSIREGVPANKFHNYSLITLIV